MDLKIPTYQWVVTLIPGTLLLGSSLMLFQLFGASHPIFDINSVATFFIFLIFALVTGEIIQAVSSMFEPLYNKTWGGKPSRVIFKKDGSYNTRVEALKEYLGANNDEECFIEAMAITNKNNLGRTAYFNISYGYMRSLLTTILFIFVLTLYLSITTRFSNASFIIMIIEVVVSAILWYRTKQRSYYYVQEVISQAALFVSNKK